MARSRGGGGHVLRPSWCRTNRFLLGLYIVEMGWSFDCHHLTLKVFLMQATLVLEIMDRGKGLELIT